MSLEAEQIMRRVGSCNERPSDIAEIHTHHHITSSLHSLGGMNKNKAPSLLSPTDNDMKREFGCLE